MGVFNSVLVECPHCGEENEDQFKPGSMDTYRFPEDYETMPLSYLRCINDKDWTCWTCQKTFRTSVEIEVKINNPQVIATDVA